MGPMFTFVHPPLPGILFEHLAVVELASTIEALYPSSPRLGSMIRLSGRFFLDAHRDDEDVARWLFHRYCDLLSVDRAFMTAGQGMVPRSPHKPIFTTAWAAAGIESQALSSNPKHAIETAGDLYYFILDRVEAISTVSTTRILLDLPEGPQ